MKVTIETNEEKEQEITFPCLMESTGSIKYKIILVYGLTKKGHYKGFVVYSSNESLYIVGCYGKWASSVFKPLPKGTKVILEN